MDSLFWLSHWTQKWMVIIVLWPLVMAAMAVCVPRILQLQIARNQDVDAILLAVSPHAP
jgi:hypothetical protein